MWFVSKPAGILTQICEVIFTTVGNCAVVHGAKDHWLFGIGTFGSSCSTRVVSVALELSSVTGGYAAPLLPTIGLLPRGTTVVAAFRSYSSATRPVMALPLRLTATGVLSS